MKERKCIIKLIDESGLKKKYICSKIGINPAYYSEFMRNPDKMSIEQATILCDLLGVSINEVEFTV